MCCHLSRNTNNGFTKSPHVFQIGSYVLFIYLSFVQYGVLAPSQEKEVERTICLIISSTLLFSVIISTVISAVTDPTDKVVRLYQNAVENGEWFDVMKYKLYCEQCASFVSDSSKHCKRCERCVQNFDHHCKWINNCIGELNYRSFFSMIVSVLFYCLFEIIQQIVCIVRVHNYSDQLESQVDISLTGVGVLVYIAFFLSLLVFVMILNLVFLHIWLISKKMTTYEYILQIREEKKIKEVKRQAELQAKLQQQAQEDTNRQEKDQIKGIKIKEKNDQVSDQSSKSGGADNDDEDEEQKSNVMNNEVRKHKSPMNKHKKEISLYSATNNQPDKIEQEIVAHLETNRTKKEINLNLEKPRKSNEKQLINNDFLQEIQENSGSIINRSMKKLTKMVSLKMIFTDKEMEQVSQPQSRQQSVSSMHNNIKLNYNQSDNIFFDRSQANKAPYNTAIKQGALVQQLKNDVSTPSMIGRPIISEQPNKLQKNVSSQNGLSQFSKVYSTSLQNAPQKEFEANSKQFSPSKVRQGMETNESMEHQLNLQKRKIIGSGDTELQQNVDNKAGSQSFDIHILDEKNQGTSVPYTNNNILSFQKETSMTMQQLDQSMDDNNKTRDKILTENQILSSQSNQFKFNSYKGSSHDIDDHHSINEKEQNQDEQQQPNTYKKNSDENLHQQNQQQPIQFKIQSKLVINDF